MRDECSSGIRSEAEDEAAGDLRPPRPSPRPKGLGSGPAHLSLSTTSSLSSCSNPSQARLVQSSLRDIRDNSTPPAPPPGTSSATSGSGDNGAGSGCSGQELGKPPVSDGGGGGSKATCMQCYLSGHSDGSLDSSVDPSIGSTEGSSASALTLSVGQRSEDNGGRGQDRDSGIVELGDKFDRCFEPAGEEGQQSDEKTTDNN